MKSEQPFWEQKTLQEMTAQEWESLCDRCGLCCIVRIEDENSGDVYDTNVICRHYDCERQACSSYGGRTGLSDGCVQLTPELVEQFDWLPDSCAYRRKMRGLPLLPGHPLLLDDHDPIASETKTGCVDSVEIVNVVDRYKPVGLIVNGPDVLPEQHLVFPDEFE